MAVMHEARTSALKALMLLNTEVMLNPLPSGISNLEHLSLGICCSQNPGHASKEQSFACPVPPATTTSAISAIQQPHVCMPRLLFFSLHDFAPLSLRYLGGFFYSAPSQAAKPILAGKPSMPACSFLVDSVRHRNQSLASSLAEVVELS